MSLSLGVAFGGFCGAGEKSKTPPRCEAVPTGGGAVSLRIDGVEIVGWNPGTLATGGKAHFYPVKTASGAMLTRMGHPGAPNHDHHRSVWFAHHDAGGEDFWSERRGVVIRQKQWLAYHDGDSWAGMAVLLGWRGADGREVMEQEMVAALSPAPDGEVFLEIQSSFRPADEGLVLGKTNFGLLGVRLAKSISAYFGDGVITDSEGRIGEGAIFGKRARWMDYGGSIAVGEGKARVAGKGGITWFDHPSNPRYPTHWHVREDGWMGASFSFSEPFTFRRKEPLVLRYLLHLRGGEYGAEKAAEVAKNFAESGRFVVEKSVQRHTSFSIRREVPEIE